MDWIPFTYEGSKGRYNNKKSDGCHMVANDCSRHGKVALAVIYNGQSGDSLATASCVEFVRTLLFCGVITTKTKW